MTTKTATKNTKITKVTTKNTKVTKGAKATAKGFRLGLLLALVLALSALSITVVYAGGSGPVIDWWVFGGGGGSASGGNVTLDGTLGQPIAGESSNGNLALQAGYWNSAPVIPGYALYLPLLRR